MDDIFVAKDTQNVLCARPSPESPTYRLDQGAAVRAYVSFAQCRKVCLQNRINLRRLSKKVIVAKRVFGI